MLESFIWMFKTPNFKQHYIKLVIVSITLLVIGTCLSFGLIHYSEEFGRANLLLYILLIFLIIFLICTPFLFLQGYFWELTSNIIERTYDIQSENVYNGKIKKISIIKLPEWNIFKFIWRGFASVVATTIMTLPWILILITYIAGNAAYSPNTLRTYISGIPAIGIPVILLIMLYIFLIPGLLWNYASRNSVFSPLNIPKAVYLSGNYTLTYILNGLLYVIVYFISICISNIISNFTGMQNLTTLINAENILPYILFQAIIIVKYSFVLYIYAYLLGTITPPSEV